MNPRANMLWRTYPKFSNAKPFKVRNPPFPKPAFMVVIKGGT